MYSARRSVCLNISSENEITVRCPYGYGSRKIEELLKRKSVWLEKHIALNIAKKEIHADLISYGAVLSKGVKLPLYICGTDEISSDAVRVKNLKNLKKLYCDTFGKEFSARVEYFGLITGLTAASVKFRSYTARWGCCDIRNNIVFNYKLLMLDGNLWDYVIVHELCHIKYHNHSKAFWRLVEKFMPDYRQRRKLLKTFDFVTSLY